MKKFFFISLLIFTNLVYAQTDCKVGFINTESLLDLMPEKKQAVTEIENFNKLLNEQLSAMQSEFDKKYDYYQTNQAKMTKLINEAKLKELNDLNQRIQNFVTVSQEELEKKQNELMQPIIEKAKNAISEVGKDNGFTLIMDVSAGFDVNKELPNSLDVLQKVAKKLGLNYSGNSTSSIYNQCDMKLALIEDSDLIELLPEYPAAKKKYDDFVKLKENELSKTNAENKDAANEKAQIDLAAKNDELFKPLTLKVNQSLKNIAAENGAVFIFNTNVVLYFQNILDLKPFYRNIYDKGSVVLPDVSKSLSVKKIKIAYVNSNDLITMIPEFDLSKAELEKLSKNLEDQLKKKHTDFENKYNDYLANEEKMSNSIKEIRQNELVEMQKSIEDFQISAQNELEKKQNDMMQPIIANAKNAINNYAAKNSYNLVLDESSGTVLFFGSNVNDITNAVGDYFKNNSNASVASNNNSSKQNNTPQTNAVKQKENVPIVPPILSVTDISFSDKNNNNRIDGDEACAINFTILNQGKGAAKNLKVQIKNTSTVSGLSFESLSSIGSITAGSKQNVSIPLNGTLNLTSGVANIKVSFEEQLGFPPDPFELNIDTKEFVKPEVKVVDYSFLTDNGVIKLGAPVQLKTLIQNVGQGTAENVNISFIYPSSNVFPNSLSTFELGNMVPGATKEVVFEFIANKLYTASTIPITIKIAEKYGKFGQNKEAIANLNTNSSGTTINIASNAVDNSVNIQIASLSSDVDKNIPLNTVKYPNKYALIIGNEDYSSSQIGLNSEVNVDYAVNDAKIFKEYCEKTLGIPERQIKLLINATLGSMNQGIAWLNNLAKVDNGNAELIFYYSGHGLPDEQTKESYLMPVDVSGTNINQAIKLADVYDKLNEHPVRKVIVFLDACFSGGARNKNLIAMKGVKVNPKVNAISGNMIVVSSSTGDESSGVYREKQHGYMTYFLLKKLQESKGEVTIKELSDYIIEGVRKETALNGKTQTPQLIYSPGLEKQISNLKIK